MNDVNKSTVKPHTEQTPMQSTHAAGTELVHSEYVAETTAEILQLKQRIAALTAALRDNVIYGHEVGGDPKRPGKICSLCCGEWEMAALESHAPDCLLQGSAK